MILFYRWDEKAAYRKLAHHAEVRSVRIALVLEYNHADIEKDGGEKTWRNRHTMN
jgi:hypothetical protein